MQSDGIVWSKWVALALIPILAGCSFTLRQRDLLAQPTQPLPPLPVAVSQESVVIPVDGATLRGWLLHNPEATRTIVFFYGNAGSVLDSAGVAAWLAGTLGADVLTIDYRGYGFSDGEATLAALGADALRIVDYAEARTPGRPTFLMGYSLGTCIAVYAAARRPVAGLVLLAPPTSIDEMAGAIRDHGPWYYKLTRITVEPELHALPQPIEDIRRVTAPLLIVHGTADEQVPFWMGQKMLARAAATTKELCAVTRADHETIMSPGQMRGCLVKYFVPR